MDKQKQQEMQEELNADEIREKSNEMDDGAYDTWLEQNYDDLVRGFLEGLNSEWKEYCKTIWNEENL